MGDPALTLRDLQAALQDIGDRFPKLLDDDLFVLWFLRAYVTDSEEHAAKAVSGGARDKGIDGVLIDDKAHGVFVVQAKYRKTLGKTSEKRADVIALAEVAHRLCETDDEAFESFLLQTEGYTADCLREARKRIVKGGYRLWLFFVTLGKVSPTTANDAKSLARKASCDAKLEIIDAKPAMLIFRDYLDGVAPPIPALDLQMEEGPNVKVNAVSQRYDSHNKIESWVFSMRGDAIAELYDLAGLRLFARNIRGFLGSATAVNQGMTATLGAEPDRFFYYNNGITVLCDEAMKQSREGRDLLHVLNPQVINGQQTTRTLAANLEKARRASVLVKVLVVPRGDSGGGDGFEDLVSRIVAGTNWQNAIRPSDLMSNDRKQIELERSLRKIGYGYVRKRQTKGEAKRMAGGKHVALIDKGEFAQIVAACELDPVIARTAKEKLFEESLYAKVFPNADAEYYLTRYWTMVRVRRAAWGDRRKTEAKWLALHFAWLSLASHVRSAKHARTYRMLCERNDYSLQPLSTAISAVLSAALRYFKQNQGQGADALDAPAFFKSKKASAAQFHPFWESCRERHGFDKHMAKAAETIIA